MYQIKNKTRTNTCPDCYEIISESKVLSFLKDEEKDIYNKFKLQKKVDRDPSLYWCPKTN